MHTLKSPSPTTLSLSMNTYVYVIRIRNMGIYIGAHFAGAKSISRFDSIRFRISGKLSRRRVDAFVHSFIHSFVRSFVQWQRGSSNNRSYIFIAWHRAYENRSNVLIPLAQKKKNTQQHTHTTL